MQMITSDDSMSKSTDLVAANVEQLKALFPQAWKEGKLDFDVLKQLLGGVVEEREERFGLNWHGKRQARQLALTPSTGTLRPCPEDSVDWDATQNLMIEGDNLEVLKILQKSYAGKVKLIYIDPPYNTGNDFVYPDDFKDNIKNYLELTGQIEGGRKISTNTEASGRFHTDWLNMMYPRLMLARELLRDDGVLFVSISDREVSHLRQLLDQVFDESNFIGNVIWNSTKTVTNTALISVSHTHNLVYAKSIDYFIKDRNRFRLPEDGSGFANPDNDPRGPWKADPFQVGGRRPNQLYEVRNPTTGQVFVPSDGCSWKNELSVFRELTKDNRIVFGVSGEAGPQRKRFLSEAMERGRVSKTIWDDIDTTANATRYLKDLLGGRFFNNPKPVDLVSRCIDLACASEPRSVVLDFFAGSGTTGESVMTKCAASGAKYRFVLVQLPEPARPSPTVDGVSEADESEVEGESAPDSGSPQIKPIAEITKERLRRAGKKLKAENPLFAGDVGFRVFKLASTNIREWDPDRDKFPQTLQDSVEHLKSDRTESDILYELLLKSGLDLCVPIEKRVIAGKDVHSIGGGVLFACLATSIKTADVEPLAQGIVDWRKQLAPAGDVSCIFRDSAFADDVAKSNLAAILEQQGIEKVRSL